MSPLVGNQRWLRGFDSYRPPDEPLCTAEYDVAELPDDAATKAFVLQHHYSGNYPAALALRSVASGDAARRRRLLAPL